MTIAFQRYNGAEWVTESEHGGAGVTNHASLTNLNWLNSKHTGVASSFAGFDASGNGTNYLENAYLLADGSRALTGAWDMGSQALTNVNIDSGNIVDGALNETYALLAGRSGGQALIGSPDASEILTLQGSSHATQGYVEALYSASETATLQPALKLRHETDGSITNGFGPALDFVIDAGTPQTIARIGAERDGDGLSGRIVFYPYSSGAGSEAMTIDTNKYVGIGVSSPGSLLEIGSTNPEVRLHNTTEEDGDGGRETEIVWRGEQSGGEESTLVRMIGQHDGAADDERGRWVLQINDGSDGSIPTEAIRVDYRGYVGIGSAPSNPLYIRKSVESDWCIDAENTHATASYGFTFASGVDSGDTTFLVRNGAKTQELFKILGNGYSLFETNTSETTALRSSFSVKLLTSGTASDGLGPKLSFLLEDDSAAEATMGEIGGYRDGADNSGGLRFRTTLAGSTSNVMTIGADGDVGIGTTDPEFRLSVEEPDNTIVCKLERLTSDTNTSNSCLQIKKTTDGDMTDGFGTGLFFSIEDSAEVNNTIGGIYCVRDSADNSGTFSFRPYSAGSANTTMEIYYNGRTSVGNPTGSPHSNAYLWVRRGGNDTGTGARARFVVQASASATDNCSMILQSGTTGDVYLGMGDEGDGDAGGLRYDNNNNTLYIRTIGANRITLISNQFKPSTDNALSCGASGARWVDVWAVDTSINSSDERWKENITDLDIGLDFINDLRPIHYKRKSEPIYETRSNEDEDGQKLPDIKEHVGDTSHTRLHAGLSAQQVKATMDKHNITSNDFAAWILDDDKRQHLRYGEFIAPMIKSIQELSSNAEVDHTKIIDLESEIESMDKRVKILEAA